MENEQNAAIDTSKVAAAISDFTPQKEAKTGTVVPGSATALKAIQAPAAPKQAAPKPKAKAPKAKNAVGKKANGAVKAAVKDSADKVKKKAAQALKAPVAE